MWKRLQGLVYAASEAVVIPTSGIGKALPAWVQNKLRIIPNPVVAPFDYAILLHENRKSFCVGNWSVHLPKGI